jgi:hypothetical protein
VWDTHAKEVVFIGRETTQGPRGQCENCRERGAPVATGREATSEDWEAFSAAPAEQHPPRQRTASATTEPKMVEIAQNGILSDHRPVKCGELGDEQVVQGALLLGRHGVVFGVFPLVAAAARHRQALLGEDEECRRMRWAISVQGSRSRTAASM